MGEAVDWKLKGVQGGWGRGLKVEGCAGWVRQWTESWKGVRGGWGSRLKGERVCRVEKEETSSKEEKKDIPKQIDNSKEAAMEAEVQAARQRAVVPLEIRMKQFRDMLAEKEVSAHGLCVWAILFSVYLPLFSPFFFFFFLVNCSTASLLGLLFTFFLWKLSLFLIQDCYKRYSLNVYILFFSLFLFSLFFVFLMAWFFFLGGGGGIVTDFCTQSCWLGRFHQLELDSYVLVLYYSLKFDGIIKCLDFHCVISRRSSSDD